MFFDHGHGWSFTPTYHEPTIVIFLATASQGQDATRQASQTISEGMAFAAEELPQGTREVRHGGETAGFLAAAGHRRWRIPVYTLVNSPGWVENPPFRMGLPYVLPIRMVILSFQVFPGHFTRGWISSCFPGHLTWKASVIDGFNSDKATNSWFRFTCFITWEWGKVDGMIVERVQR